MAIAGVVVLGPLVPILIKVAVQFPFQDLLDTALLEFLQKTVGLVPRFELLQEIVVEQSYFLHYVQIFKIGQKNQRGHMPPLILYLHTL